MIRYDWETSGSPITWDVIYWPVHPWHFSNRAEGSTNALPPTGNTPIFLEGRVDPRGERPSQCICQRFEKFKGFPFRIENPRIVQLYILCSFTVSYPATWLSLILLCSDVVEKHQLMIAWGIIDISTGQPYQVYVANLSARPILFAENMGLAYASKALDYNLHRWGEETSYGKLKMALARINRVLR